MLNIIASTLMLALTNSADAAPVWNWEAAQERIWYLESHTILPQPLWFQAQHNDEARVGRVEVRLIARCHPAAHSGRRQRIDCRLDDVAFSGTALAADTGQLTPVLEEMDALVSGKTVSLEMNADGTMASFDLEGWERSDRRASEQHELIRQLLQSTFAGLDLKLPTTNQPGDGWRQRNPRLIAYPDPMAGMVIGKANHAITQRDAVALEIQTNAQISMALGASGNIHPDSKVMRLYGDLESMALFNEAEGVLVGRTWMVHCVEAGQAGTTGVYIEGDTAPEGAVYIQAGLVRLLDGEPLPEVGPTGENQFQGTTIAWAEQALWGEKPDIHVAVVP